MSDDSGFEETERYLREMITGVDRALTRRIDEIEQGRDESEQKYLKRVLDRIDGLEARIDNLSKRLYECEQVCDPLNAIRENAAWIAIASVGALMFLCIGIAIA